MELAEFEQLVNEAIGQIPDNVRRNLKNVAFVVEHYHRQPRSNEIVIRRGAVLLGLYQGVPLTRRGGPSYNMVLPDKITIFQYTIEQIAGGDPVQIRKIVTDTVHHEIGHYL